MAKLSGNVTTFVLIGVVGLGVWFIGEDESLLGTLTNPGALSPKHDFLSQDCAACHTPGRGVEDKICILCHANATTVLQRQPTAFHADIGDCAKCHQEHRPFPHKMSEMDHDLLAKIGIDKLKNEPPASEAGEAAQRLDLWIRSAAHGGVSPELTIREQQLNCATCHSNDDRHFDLFGSDCAACHDSKSWNISEFIHPASNSLDCAQCHQAPPSHYMMHFKMISATVAEKPHAKVSQCFLCHQTTAWTDIVGKGFYKHH